MPYSTDLTSRKALLEVIRDCRGFLPWPTECNCGDPNLDTCVCIPSQLERICLANLKPEEGEEDDYYTAETDF